MKLEDHVNLMKELSDLTKGGEGQARSSEIIATLTKDYTETNDNINSINIELNKIKDDNQRLLVSNNNLLLELPQFKAKGNNSSNNATKDDIIKDEEKPFDLKKLGID